MIEAQCRYVPGSKALARYLDDLVPWQDNPTVLMRRAAARPPGRMRRDGDHAEPGRAELRG
ncbi:hypothetical protein GCM10022403_038920 [Streptomyces coacervatus]|uniref:Transposase n=1 Tax=Streptomyces coacervatus TaxID=647381 RepID=A0ABP7HT00_9ACTN